MIGLGTLFKKNISNYDPGSDPIPDSFERGQSHDAGSREIRPRLQQDICGLCGRTILTGEKTDLFRGSDNSMAIVVCQHCRSDAAEAGYQRMENPLLHSE